MSTSFSSSGDGDDKSSFSLPASELAEEGYISPTKDYRKARKLHKRANFFFILAFAVGIVIIGEFAGFNTGFFFGGFGGFVISLSITSFMFFILMLNFSELSSTMSFSGGTYAFGRAALGKFGGLTMGLIELNEFFTGMAASAWFTAILSGIAFRVNVEDTGIVFGLSSAIVWGLAVPIQLIGGLTMWISCSLLSLYSVLLILLYFFGVVGFLEGGDNLALYPIEPHQHLSRSEIMFPEGVEGVFSCFAASLWLFLGIEMIPLVAGETKHPKRDLPRAMMLGIVILIVLAWMVVLGSALCPPGVASASVALAPLSAGFRKFLGKGITKQAIAGIQIPPCIGSVCIIMFAVSRQIFALSRAGYLPTFLSRTWSWNGVPWVATIVGGLLVSVSTVVVAFGTIYAPSDILFNSCTISCLLIYILVNICFIILRIQFPPGELDRPFQAPTGIPGAVIVILLSLLCLICSFIAIPTYKYGLILPSGILVLGWIYYFAWSRFRLRVTEEERFAMFDIYKAIVIKDMNKGIQYRRPNTGVWRVLNLFR